MRVAGQRVRGSWLLRRVHGRRWIGVRAAHRHNDGSDSRLVDLWRQLRSKAAGRLRRGRRGLHAVLWCLRVHLLLGLLVGARREGSMHGHRGLDQRVVEGVEALLRGRLLVLLRHVELR